MPLTVRRRRAAAHLAHAALHPGDPLHHLAEIVRRRAEIDHLGWVIGVHEDGPGVLVDRKEDRDEHDHADDHAAQHAGQPKEGVVLLDWPAPGQRMRAEQCRQQVKAVCLIGDQPRRLVREQGISYHCI